MCSLVAAQNFADLILSGIIQYILSSVWLHRCFYDWFVCVSVIGSCVCPINSLFHFMSMLQLLCSPSVGTSAVSSLEPS